MEIGNKIKQLRKEKNLSQEELSEIIGVTRQTISKWELSETYPDLNQSKKLSKVFNISLDELVGNDIKDILIEKTDKTQKVVNKSYSVLKIISFILISLIVIIILLYSLKVINKSKNGTVLRHETIVCNLYGENHSFGIRYYELTGVPKELGGDSYFQDILELDKYNDAHQIFNIINDYVKKNNGTCEIVENKELNDLVNITIKDISNTRATITIEDHSPNKIIYGESFYIEKYEETEWKSLDFINDNFAFNMMAYFPNKDGILEMNQNWEYIYGKLEKGFYRLVKDVSFESDKPITDDDKYLIWVEFEIE